MTNIMVLLMSQEVYASEAIEWTKVEFVNNDAILTLYNEV